MELVFGDDFQHINALLLSVKLITVGHDFAIEPGRFGGQIRVFDGEGSHEGGLDFGEVFVRKVFDFLPLFQEEFIGTANEVLGTFLRGLDEEEDGAGALLISDTARDDVTELLLRSQVVVEGLR